MKPVFVLGLLVLVLPRTDAQTPPLRTAVQVHRLPRTAAERALPVQLRGVVTQTMPEWQGFSFQDNTDALYVSVASTGALMPDIGDKVEIRGQTAPGNFAPIVRATAIRVSGRGPMPKPRQVDWRYISSGACDNDYVEVEGVIRSVTVVDPPSWRWHATALHVDIGGNLLWAYLRDTDDLQPARLPDSSARIRGVCVVLANSRRQFEQNILLVPKAKNIEIVNSAREDPFSTPLTTIDHLFEFRPSSNLPHVARVRGTVTSVEPRRIFLQDEREGLLVRTTLTAPVKVGDIADVVGFPAAGTYSKTLEDAIVRPSGSRSEPAPLRLGAGEVLTRSYEERPNLPDATLVRTQGLVLETNRSVNRDVFTLQDGASVFTARLPRAQGATFFDLKQGSRVDVTGVCLIQVDDLGLPRTFELLMRSPADVHVLDRAPWLTLPIALRGLAVLLAVAGGSAIWVVLLRKRVRKQTQIIRQQIEREASLGRRFRELVENATDMVYIRDLDGRLLHVNQGTVRLTGYSREELLHLNFLELLAPEQREEARQQMGAKAVAEEGHFEVVEWRFLRKDAREITVEVKQRFLTESDGQMRVESIGRDVTARNQAISDNQERFQTLADNIAQLAWMADEKGFTFWYNQRWFDYTGASLDECRGWGWWKWHHPDHVERVVSRIQHSFESGDTWEDTFPLRDRGGQYRWFLGRGMPIRDQNGRVVRWFGTNTDITKQKQVETELELSNKDLRQFAYVASHDLQEPLRNVRIFAQMLARTFSNGELTTQRSKYIEIVTGGARRMEALIMDLLTYSSVRTAEAPNQQKIDCELAFESAIQNLSTSIRESGAVITHGPLPTIVASGSQITQVLQNLIGNSIKYRRSDIRLQVHIDAERRGDEWLFTVRDNGTGFDQKYSEQVFGIFKRLHGPGLPGTGMGLAICKNIIERHGGRIWAEAHPAHGATFYFSIPDLASELSTERVSHA